MYARLLNIEGLLTFMGTSVAIEKMNLSANEWNERETLLRPYGTPKLKTSLRQGSEIEWIIHENLLLKQLSRPRTAIVSLYEAARSQGKKSILSKLLKSFPLGRTVFLEILNVQKLLWCLPQTMRY